MDDKKLFRIGEVAAIFNVSVGTLRHYEQVGILKPEYIDKDSGYRYYCDKQFEILNTIRYLRVLDMSLVEIADFLKNRDIDMIEDKLVKQKSLIIQKQKELELIKKKIDNRLMEIEDARNSELNVIKRDIIPENKLVWIRDNLKINTYLDLEASIRKLQTNQSEPVVFIGKVGVGITEQNLLNGKFDNYELVFLILDDEDKFENKHKFNIEVFPEMECVTVRFCGGHKESPAYYRKMLKYIEENDLQITGFSREITLIDNGLTNDESKFVTKISIPVKSK